MWLLAYLISKTELYENVQTSTHSISWKKKSFESCLFMSEVSSLFSCSLLPFSILKHIRLLQLIQPATLRFMDFFPQKNMAPQASRMCITWGKGVMPRKPLSWNEWTKRMIKFRLPYLCPSYLSVCVARDIFVVLCLSPNLIPSFLLSCCLTPLLFFFFFGLSLLPTRALALTNTHSQSLSPPLSAHFSLPSSLSWFLYV